MSCSCNELLDLAREQLGITEQPSGSNTVKYNTAYYGRAVSGTAYPWCCVFVWWLFDRCGGSSLFFGGKKTASCTALMNYAKANGLWVTSGYAPGDLILYSFTSGTAAEHIGICESADSSRVTCIEGNTGVNSNDNGGAVMRRTRNLKTVLGAYRPAYSKINTSAKGGVDLNLPILKRGSKGNSVKALQILLNGYGFNCGSVDGDFGTKTLSAVRLFQSSMKLEIDGVVGKNTWSELLG